MASIDPSGHNIGELMGRGVALTTREVLALIHEVCRDAAAAFPQSPDDLWITDMGELLIARSDQVNAPVDPRNGVASLLEAMLPAEGAVDPSHVVPKALRGLPARLRATAEDIGPQDRRDLMSILSFHMGGDPRDVIQQLVRRVIAPLPAATAASPDEELALSPAEDVTSPSSAAMGDIPLSHAAPRRPAAPTAAAQLVAAPAVTMTRNVVAPQAKAAVPTVPGATTSPSPGNGSAPYPPSTRTPAPPPSVPGAATGSPSVRRAVVPVPVVTAAATQGPRPIAAVPVVRRAAAPPPSTTPMATPPPEPPRSGARAATALALLAIAFLFIGIGSASYWLFRNDLDRAPERVTEDSARASEERTPPGAMAESAVPTAAAPSNQDSSAATPGTAASVAAGAATSPSVESQQTPAPARVASAVPAPLQINVNDGAFSPTFAATGRELFFHAGRSSGGRLLVANLDGSGQVSRVSAVRNDGARDYHPRVSPDGRWIAFDSDRHGERGVYVAGRDGASAERVSGSGYAAVPSWSPDMKWLAFVRGESGRSRVWNLWLRNLSTGELQRHSSFRSGQVWGASWFPDGRTLCYSHDQQLIISHLDGREDIVINSPRRGRLVRTPAVSPDGKSVVFQVFNDGVWLVDVRTRQMRRILDDASAEEFAWSPDGSRIAYHSRRDGAWKIWVMQLAGV